MTAGFACKRILFKIQSLTLIMAVDAETAQIMQISESHELRLKVVLCKHLANDKGIEESAKKMQKFRQFIL